MNIILTKEFLEYEYIVKEVDVKTIAKNTGFSYSYIQSKIKQFNIPRKRKHYNLLGKKFGKLMVVEFCGVDDKKQALWKCLCDCGKYKIVKASRLKNGEVKSCGCLHKTRYGDISGSHFANIRVHAKYKNRVFDIKIEDIWDLYIKQNKTCALSGEYIHLDPKNKLKTTASLDRIDSSMGYTINNVQWVHKDINQMKSNRSDEDFLSWVKKIHDFNFK